MNFTQRKNSPDSFNFLYDGFDRLVELRYPNASTPGVSNPADNELFTYDLNGNVLTKTTRADDVITNTYDALNRILSKAPGADPVVQYFYSARGQQTEIRFADLSQHVKHSYDAAGRITSTETKLPSAGISASEGRLDYTYDAASNRTSIKHQGQSSRTFNYAYDASSRMVSVDRSGDVLASYAYDHLGRRTKYEQEDGGTSRTVNYFYEPDSALDQLQHLMGGSSNDVDYFFSYNLANQVTVRTVNNSTFQFAPVAREETYTANGLNQYTQMVKDQVLRNFTYDANGNLTSDGVWVYTYDVENRLINATDGSTNVTYVYDPLGRRVKKSGAGVTETYYLSDGTEEVLELNSSGQVQNRYVFGGFVRLPSNAGRTYPGPWLTADGRRPAVAG